MTGVGRSRNLVLAAMIFAVSMTFIDQTIVAIAAPRGSNEKLGLFEYRYAVGNQCLPVVFSIRSLHLAAAWPTRSAHKKMVVLGVIVFAGSSALCGLTPTGGSPAEAWIVSLPDRTQGLGGALMFPAALAIVVQTFDLHPTGQGLGCVLRHCRRLDRRRADPRRLPHPVDLAGHLLGQHPGCPPGLACS